MRSSFVLIALLIACGGPRTREPASARTSAPAPAGVDLEPCARFNLERINQIRAQAGVAPLVRDPELDAFARAGSEQYARDHAPHAHIAAHGKEMGGRQRGENQGAPRGFPVDPNHLVPSANAQIDAMLQNMMAEGNGGGHHDHLVNPRYRKLGAGLHLVGDRLFVTNDFTD